MKDSKDETFKRLKKREETGQNTLKRRRSDEEVAAGKKMKVKMYMEEVMKKKWKTRKAKR